MEILQELKETIADIRNWDGAAMKAWDQSHRLIKEGNKSDLPRLIYENTISGYMETMIKSADEIERLRKEVERLSQYKDKRLSDETE